MIYKPAEIIRNIRSNYNTIAKEWDVSRFRPSKLKVLLLKNAKQGMIVGDIGCGNGIIIPELLKREIKKYYGLDISSKLIAIAKKKYSAEVKKGRVEFKVGNALKLPYPKNKFDVVFSLATMHHVPGEENQVKFLREIFRTLKKNGKAIIINWNLLNPVIRRRFERRGSVLAIKEKEYGNRDVYVRWRATRQDINARRFIHIFVPEEIKTLAKQAGFTKIKTEYYSQLGTKEKNGGELVTILQK